MQASNQNPFGRSPVCGFISAYNATALPPGPKDLRSVLVNRLTLRSFIVFDFADRYEEAARDLGRWYAEGKIKLREDVREGGVDAYASTLPELYSGGNFGKLVLRV